MKPFRDNDEIGAALAELRPAIRPEFAAELDTRAAAGFPRDSRSSGSWAAGLLERLRSTPPRRMLAPAGALATAAIVVATAVVVAGSGGGDTTGAGGGRTLGALNPAQEAEAPERTLEPFAGKPAGESPSSSSASSGSAGTGYAGDAAIEGSLKELQGGSVPLSRNLTSGPYASGTSDRAIERSAEVVIGTDPAEIRAAAGKVFDAVHAADGIVLNSSIREGEAGKALADFELLIPSGKLGDALADFSAIGEVRSRSEATQDITAPTVGVGERLQDTRARIDGLLAQLAEADTDSERIRVESELRNERYRAASLKSRLSDLERRANFSPVSLRIETGAAGSSQDSGEGGAWGVSDGLDDAGRVLEVAAAVTLLGLAILTPFALVALLAWLAHGAWVRRARRDALART